MVHTSGGGGLSPAAAAPMSEAVGKPSAAGGGAAGATRKPAIVPPARGVITPVSSAGGGGGSGSGSGSAGSGGDPNHPNRSRAQSASVSFAAAAASNQPLSPLALASPQLSPPVHAPFAPSAFSYSPPNNTRSLQSLNSLNSSNRIQTQTQTHTPGPRAPPLSNPQSNQRSKLMAGGGGPTAPATTTPVSDLQSPQPQPQHPQHQYQQPPQQPPQRGNPTPPPGLVSTPLFQSTHAVSSESPMTQVTTRLNHLEIGSQRVLPFTAITTPTTTPVTASPGSALGPNDRTNPMRNRSQSVDYVNRPTAFGFGPDTPNTVSPQRGVASTTLHTRHTSGRAVSTNQTPVLRSIPVSAQTSPLHPSGVAGPVRLLAASKMEQRKQQDRAIGTATPGASAGASPVFQPSPAAVITVGAPPVGSGTPTTALSPRSARPFAQFARPNSSGGGSGSAASGLEQRSNSVPPPLSTAPSPPRVRSSLRRSSVAAVYGPPSLQSQSNAAPPHSPSHALGFTSNAAPSANAPQSRPRTPSQIGAITSAAFAAATASTLAPTPVILSTKRNRRGRSKSEVALALPFGSSGGVDPDRDTDVEDDESDGRYGMDESGPTNPSASADLDVVEPELDRDDFLSIGSTGSGSHFSQSAGHGSISDTEDADLMVLSNAAVTSGAGGAGGAGGNSTATTNVVGLISAPQSQPITHSVGASSAVSGGTARSVTPSAARPMSASTSPSRQRTGGNNFKRKKVSRQIAADFGSSAVQTAQNTQNTQNTQNIQTVAQSKPGRNAAPAPPSAAPHMAYINPEQPPKAETVGTFCLYSLVFLF